MPTICPKCRERIRHGALWTPLHAAQGCTRVMQVRHDKADGHVCVAYVGERLGARAVPLRATGPDYRAGVFALADALQRRAG